MRNYLTRLAFGATGVTRCLPTPKRSNGFGLGGDLARAPRAFDLKKWEGEHGGASNCDDG